MSLELRLFPQEWQYNSAHAESAELSDTFEILKPVDGHTDYQLLYNPVKEEAANLTSLPESPHSLRSTNSQDFVCPGDMFGATSAQHLMYSPQKAGCQPSIAGCLPFCQRIHLIWEPVQAVK